MPFASPRNQAAQPVPGPRTAALLTSGIFDATYYATAAGIGRVTPEEAASHFLALGAAQGVSPHPLLELTQLPDDATASLDAEDSIQRLVAYLHSDAARNHAWGPLFDPASPTLDGIDPVWALNGLPDDASCPVPVDFPVTPPTMGAARAGIASFMAGHRLQFSAKLPPRRKKWDREGTRNWVARALGTPIPTPCTVSVIMPALNRESTIAAAMESVLTQTHRDIELIVVDDGSSDRTPEIVAEYAAKDSRVRLFGGPHQGVGAARNEGILHATGDYVAFLDSDNTWTGRFVELSLRGLAMAPEAVASHAGLRLHRKGRIEHRGGPVQLDDLQLGNSIDINVLLVRAEALRAVGSFDTSIRRWVDYDLVLRLARLGPLQYLPFIGCDYDDKPSEGRITGRESPHWQWAVRERNLVNWDEVRSACSSRVPGRTSVVVILLGVIGGAVHTIDRLLDSGADDIEVVVVDNGSAPANGRKIVARYLAEDRVRYKRLPTGNPFALAANLGFAQSTGEQVAFLTTDQLPRDGWLQALLARKRTTGATAVQALTTNPDGTILSAGHAFFDGAAYPGALLTGLPVQDAEISDLNDLTAVVSSPLLIGAQDFASLGGFDPLFANGLEDVDLCFRARESLGDTVSFACAADAIVMDRQTSAPARARRQHENRRIFRRRWQNLTLPDDTRRYASLAFQVAHLMPGRDGTEPYVSPVLVRDRTAALRWAIKTGAPNTPGGDHWGDIPFAEDLARALRARDQQVVIDRHEAELRPSSYLDDVVLTLRGRHAISPHPRAINMMWVISRPDLVTTDEVEEYDAVFAASEKWAAWMTAKSGTQVGVMLQATDPERFRPDLPLLDEPDDVIFVGGSHGHEYGRAIVGLAIQAGAPLGLWGPGWQKFAPKEAVRGGYLDFALTPRAYRSAQIVLNDHFEDMAEWGFVNNRAFDAIACGTPVISDVVDGLEMFGGAAVTADSVEQMARLVTDRSWMPSQERMLELAQMVRTKHTFAARADTLIEAAQEIRHARGAWRRG